MLKGKKVQLTSIEKEDLKALRDWRNNEAYRKYFREYRELNMSNQEIWFNEKVLKDPTTIMFAIRENNEIIGCCGFVYINWIHGNADLSIYIGKDDIYIDAEKNGYAWESLNLLLEYGFDRLRLHKVWTEIYSFDEKKHSFFNAYGLHLDGVLRDNYFYDGKFQDSHIFSILDSEWREKHRSE